MDRKLVPFDVLEHTNNEPLKPVRVLCVIYSCRYREGKTQNRYFKAVERWMTAQLKQAGNFSASETLEATGCKRGRDVMRSPICITFRFVTLAQTCSAALHQICSLFSRYTTATMGGLNHAC